MEIKEHFLNNVKTAELISGKILLHTVEDAIDLIGNLSYLGFDKIILYEKNITPEFFNLKNKMAGEILQKFAQYQMALTIVGEFSKFDSKSLNDFIFESNKGKQINFVANITITTENNEPLTRVLR
ncbi:DUF4180 domain-containing protein [Flavobacterium flavipallidum]|uniref:DUF4180 domain-containing protein n=1 Tax=Flavobacterium flavipallidum TaxID=3139140 RepID=A0ABU9HRJ9_9FLAO